MTSWAYSTMAKQTSKCYDMMEFHSSFNCNQHLDKYECPDTIIDYNGNSKGYRIIIHDGWTSGIEIKFCPWCGTKLNKYDRSQ